MSSLTEKENNENMRHAAVVGGTGMALSFMLVPWEAKFFGLPAPLAMGLAMAGSSFVSATMADTVYEALPENESDLLYSSTAPVLTGAVNAGVAYAVLGKHLNNKAALEFFGVGLVAEVGGGYINESLLGPAIDLD